MKSLTPAQIKALIHRIEITQDHELDCSECQAHVAEFVERQLVGAPLDETLKRVEQHLELCPQCREEWRALEAVLGSGD